MKSVYTIPIVCLTLAGCTQQPANTAASSPAAPRAIQYDDAQLHVEGDTWIFAFPKENGQSYIVGENVAFVEEADAHVVVNLDQTETQKSQGQSPASYTLTNVSTAGDHSVLFVTTSGTSECNIELSDSESLAEVLTRVLNSKDGSSGETKP